jgi:CheY-like chemotaxis protein
MEMVGRLSSSVIHDLNNLLTVIQLNSALIEGGGLSEEEVATRANQIGLACKQSAHLTRKVLDLARHRVAEERPVTVNTLVTELERLFKAFVAKKASVRAEVGDQPLWVMGSASDLEQVLMNLVLNAIDSMPDGGEIVISCRASVVEGSAMVELAVQDVGCGIPEDVRGRILEPFFTTRGDEGGTGMGLYIVDEIVRRHHGRIAFEPAPVRGTIVSICLPAIPPPDSAERVPVVKSVEPAARVVLLVEDDENIRQLTRFILTRVGYVVLSAETGEEAMSLWSDRRDEIKLLLADLVLPGELSGRDVVIAALADRPALPVLYISGFAAEWDEQASFDEAHFLAKPFHPDVLLAKVAEALQSAPVE